VGPKQKTVISLDAEDLAFVEDLVRARHFVTVSEFVRLAIREKLADLAETELAATPGPGPRPGPRPRP